MKKILFLQTRIPEYRIPLFAALSGHYEVTVLHSRPTDATADVPFRELIVPEYQLGPMYWQSGLIQEVQRGAYDAVISMFAIQWISSVLAMLLPRNVAYLTWGHRFTSNQIANRVRVYLMKRADGNMLYGTEELAEIIRAGVSEESLFIAPNTIHVENSEDTSSMNKKSFLFVGRAQKRKKVDMLLKAFSAVHTELPDEFQLEIVGEGEENILLQQLAHSLGVQDRVVFHGSITKDEELKPIFARAAAYVSPGAVGLGVLHSFAYGVPVVTRHGEYHGPEFCNLSSGENALLFDGQEELQEILLRLATNESCRKVLGKAAYLHYSNRRSLQKMIAGMREAIEVCVERYGR